jgi:negative regulator of sigma E activity
MQTYKYLIHHKDLRRKRNFIWYVVLTLLLWGPHTLFADISTLERIAEAESKVSYIGIRLGTFISPRGTRTFEALVIHKSPDVPYAKELSVVGERKSFEDSRGEDRRDNRRRDRDENRRNGRDRDQEHQKWHQVKSLFSEKQVELIAQNYNLEKSPSTEEIANYETDLLTITPKFTGRPTHRIFFARENGVILRVEALDPEGVLRAMSVYTRISFDAEAVERRWEVFQEEIKPEPQHSHSISLADGEKILKIKPIQPEYLPPGFQLQDIHGIKDKKNTIHLIYTDGLLRFSIFETTDKRARRGRDRRRGSDVIEIDGTHVHKHQRGPTYAFSWSSENIHFFLFGAMPATEMQKVVKSIIHKAKEK